jgi:hypothetical protein
VTEVCFRHRQGRFRTTATGVERTDVPPVFKKAEAVEDSLRVSRGAKWTMGRFPVKQHWERAACAFR